MQVKILNYLLHLYMCIYTLAAMKSITCSATSPATATPSTAVSATSATNTLTVTELSNRTAQSPICAGEKKAQVHVYSQ